MKIVSFSSTNSLKFKYCLLDVKFEALMTSLRFYYKILLLVFYVPGNTSRMNNLPCRLQ